MTTTGKSRIIVVLDTDSYSGNFEQEIAAYTTGASSEHTRAIDILKQVPKKVQAMFEDTMESVADEHGWAPWAMWRSPDDHYNSVALFFCNVPTAEMLSVIETRAKEFCEANKIKFLGKRILYEVTTLTEIQGIE